MEKQILAQTILDQADHGYSEWQLHQVQWWPDEIQ